MRVSSDRKKVLISVVLIVMLLFFDACGIQNVDQVTESSGDPSIEQTTEFINGEDKLSIDKEEAIPQANQITEGIEALFTNPIAEIEDKNIYLNITEAGEYMLHINDQCYTYHWEGITPRGILPSLAYEDFDGDGQAELAVILYSGSGTGISIYELHMLEIKQAGDIQQIDEYVYQPDQYISQLQEVASITLYDQASLLKGELLVAGDQRYEVDLQALQAPDYGTINDTLIWGSIAAFSVEGRQLVGTFGVAVGAEKAVSPIYIGELKAAISYKDGEFTMSQFEFKEDENK